MKDEKAHAYKLYVLYSSTIPQPPASLPTLKTMSALVQKKILECVVMAHNIEVSS